MIVPKVVEKSTPNRSRSLHVDSRFAQGRHEAFMVRLFYALPFATLVFLAVVIWPQIGVARTGTPTFSDVVVTRSVFVALAVYALLEWGLVVLAVREMSGALPVLTVDEAADGESAVLYLGPVSALLRRKGLALGPVAELSVRDRGPKLLNTWNRGRYEWRIQSGSEAVVARMHLPPGDASRKAFGGVLKLVGTRLE